jgi:hypothetical protein
MKKLIAYYGDCPEYVEGFTSDCERSCEGSLHLLPRKTMTVTADELEFIKAKMPHIFKKIRVVAESKHKRIFTPKK